MGLIFLAAMFVCGCGGSAELDMRQAKDAMENAKRVYAGKFAPENYEKAQKAWDHAEAAEKDGSNDKAKVLYSSAKIFFGKAAEIAVAKQDALTRQISSMQLLINENLGKVRNDLLTGNLSSTQRSQVRRIVSEVDKDKATIAKLAAQKDLVEAVALSKDVQTKIYHAQLIIAGQTPGK
jgi:hypothetical protein